MSADDLKILADQAGPIDQAAAQAATAALTGEPPAPATPPPEIDLAALKDIIGSGVTILGSWGCRALKVSDLANQEGRDLGGCLVDLMLLYDIGPKNPKTAAWLNLGLVSLAIAGSRTPLPREEVEPDQDGEPAAAADSAAPPTPKPSAYGAGEKATVLFDATPKPKPPRKPRKKTKAKKKAAKRAPR